MGSRFLGIAVGLLIVAAGLLLPQAQVAKATDTSTYCETKYYCAYISYSAPSGTSRTINGRLYKGSRGCQIDEFNNCTCGAERWRYAYFSDDYQWPGDSTWYNDRTSSGSWYYNDTYDYWRCDCVSNSMAGDAWRVRNAAQFYESGYYWHVPGSGAWIWYF
ncbi:MAG TPA: hypothetical protein DEU95_09705 [Chloroflexi bacterium]|nr:hypothetical protein [Chloroflexota bacterium]HCG29992.1 hypothetical protein [Chloroflexota bacterium]